MFSTINTTIINTLLLFCVDSANPKKSSKKVSPKPSPRKEDSGKYKSAEFVETDESSSEDEKREKKVKRKKKEVVKF
jgi:hypothetical protein